MNNNKLSGYLLYAFGEIFLVVIGILIAVNINNWNVDRKNRVREIQYLENIKLDLEKDLNSLAELIQHRKEKLSATSKLIAQVNGAPITDLDELVRNVSTAMGERKFMPNNTTFSELSNSGNLNLISNDSIKLLLLDLTNNYAFNLEMIEHETFDYREYISRPTAANFDLNKHLPIYRGEQTAQELNVKAEDFERLLQSLEYKNGLHIIWIMSEGFIPLYEEIIRKSTRIVEIIDQELKAN